MGNVIFHPLPKNFILALDSPSIPKNYQLTSPTGFQQGEKPLTAKIQLKCHVLLYKLYVACKIVKVNKWLIHCQGVNG